LIHGLPHGCRESLGGFRFCLAGVRAGVSQPDR